jgi:hypothetical protein
MEELEKLKFYHCGSWAFTVIYNSWQVKGMLNITETLNIPLSQTSPTAS